MPKTVLEYAGRRHGFDAAHFNEVIHSEIYGADWEVPGSEGIDLKLEKGRDGPISIARFATWGPGLRLRRSVRLIRQFSGDFYFCRLIERGCLKLMSSRGCCRWRAAISSWGGSEVPMSPNYFSRVFKAVHGCTPASFRRLHKMQAGAALSS